MKPKREINCIRPFLSVFLCKASTRYASHVALMRDIRNAYRISVDKYEAKISLGRLRFRWGITLKLGL